MEAVVPILEPLAEATELLTEESTVTAGAIYPLLYDLIQKDLAPKEKHTDVAKSLKEDISMG